MTSSDLILVCEKGDPQNTWLTTYKHYKGESEYYELSDEPVRLHHYVEYIQSDLENWNYHGMIDIVETIIGDISATWGDEDAVLRLVANWAKERTWLP